MSFSTRLCTFNKALDSSNISISLDAWTDPALNYWKFSVEFEEENKGNSEIYELSLRKFLALRDVLISQSQDKELDDKPSKYSITIAKDNDEFIVNIDKLRFILSNELVKFIIEGEYLDFFDGNLLKCNSKLLSERENNIFCWRDEQTFLNKKLYPKMDKYIFPIEKFFNGTSEELDISLRLYTKPSIQRWFIFIDIKVRDGGKSRLLSLLPVDFLYLRDILFQLEQTNSISYNEYDMVSGEKLFLEKAYKNDFLWSINAFYKNTRIRENKEKITLSRPAIKFLADGSYLQKIYSNLLKFNHSLWPDHRWWFFNKQLVIDYATTGLNDIYIKPKSLNHTEKIKSNIDFDINKENLEDVNTNISEGFK
jgi:hypothetical protein